MTESTAVTVTRAMATEGTAVTVTRAMATGGTAVVNAQGVLGEPGPHVDWCLVEVKVTICCISSVGSQNGFGL